MNSAARAHESTTILPTVATRSRTEVRNGLTALRGGRAPSSDGIVDLEDPGTWDRLLQMVGPASLLVVAEARMGPRLLESFRPEDVLQDVMMQAWAARAKLEWRGLQPFRNWLLTVLDNRIRDLRGYQSARKRGGDVRTVHISDLSPTQYEPVPASGDAQSSASPSRLAIHHEQARVMRDALHALPQEFREVLQLRIFEGRTAEEAAEELGIGTAAIRYRLRRGSELYRARLLKLFRSRSEERSPA